MYKMVHINIMYSSAHRDPRALEPLVAGTALDWVRYSQFGWLLWTGSSIFEVTERLKAVLDQNDQFLVSAFSSVDPPGGRLPQWIWDWINLSRNAMSGQANAQLNIFAQPGGNQSPPGVNGDTSGER